MIHTTLNKIFEAKPVEKIWLGLLAHLNKTDPDDEPLPLSTVLDAVGLDECLWCLQTVPEHDREWRLYAIRCARKVQHLATNQRNDRVLEVAKKFANGKATADQLAHALTDAEDSVGTAVRRAAQSTAKTDAWAAAWYAVWYAAGAAAQSGKDQQAAWSAIRAEQETELRRVFAEAP